MVNLGYLSNTENVIYNYNQFELEVATVHDSQNHSIIVWTHILGNISEL